ncbi:MAG: two-component system regulatory protein YycI [Tissierellia bacterium]|nr:two-component system regulatory protein YycI [Tissierellia bacterium]
MDWSKAKTILIIALIIANIILGYSIYTNENIVDETLSDDFIEVVIGQLENRNITIDTEIPRENPELMSLSVEYEKIDTEEMNKTFFQGKGTIIPKGQGLVEIAYEDELISIINDKLIRYESNHSQENHKINSEEDAVKVATDFLNENNVPLSDMKLSFVRESDGIYDLEFTKFYGDYYLESTFTNIKVDSTGVKRFERNWLNTIEIGEKAIEITSAPKSLLAVLGKEEVQGKTIKDISICYYFDPGKHGYNENPGEVRQGTTIPAWRIQFNDGYKLFVDNY